MDGGCGSSGASLFGVVLLDKPLGPDLVNEFLTMTRGAILEEKKLEELSNKGSEAQQSSHGIEDKESMEALGDKMGELSMRREKVCQE